MSGKRYKAAACTLIPLLSAAFVFSLSATPQWNYFTLKGTDLLTRVLAKPEKADDRIVILEVDQRSLDYLEKDNLPFPWPRSLYGVLIDYCRAAGAKAVLFDILFLEKNYLDVGEDMLLAESIGRAGIVHLAASFPMGQEGVTELPGSRFGIPFDGTPPAPIVKKRLLAPHRAHLEAAAGIGSVSQRPDEDGVYRRVEPFVVFQGRLFPALFSSPLVGEGARGRFSANLLEAAGMKIPLDGKGRMMLRFHGPRGTYRKHPVVSVLSSAYREAEGLEPVVSREEFRDAYVFVGYTAPGLFDLKPTPLSPVTPGVEINATALDNLLHGDFLQEAPWWVSALLGFAAAVVVASAVLLIPSPGTAVIAAVAVYLLSAAGLFAFLSLSFRQGTVMNLVAVEMTPLLSFLGASIFRYQTEGKERRFLKGAFSRYVSSKVVREIVENPDRLKLGGEKKVITLFFSDLAGFTSLSEKLTPQELVSLMNDYLSVLSQVIMEREGTVDKFIGDAVMAFWGAPYKEEHHARTALLAALECQERLREFCRPLAEAGGPSLRTRIGINTGECTVGNMGSRERFDYTAVGDAVNQASRMEGLNNAYGTDIIASETTWEQAGGAVFGRLLDYVKVKGKKLPVRIYEVMAAAGEETELMIFLKDRYEEAFGAYTLRRWEEAAAALGAVLERHDDPPSRNLLERVEQYRKSPPPEDWDGSFAFLTK